METVKSISQGEGEEQGDALMPLLFSLGQHSALDAVYRRLHVGERLFAYLDDVHVVLYVSAQLLDHVSLNVALGADDEGLDWGGGEVGPGADTPEVCGGQARSRDDGGHYDQHANGTGPFTFRKDARLLGRKTWRDVKSYRCRRAVEGELQENGGARPQCDSFLGAKIGPGVKPSGTELADGEKRP